MNNRWKSFKVYLSSWKLVVTQTSRSPQTSWKLLSIYIIAKPKSGALVSLFSSPSLYWIKTVIKLFTGCRRVSPRGFRDQSRSWGVTRCGRRSTRMLVSGIFKQPGILVVVPDVLSKFSKIGNVFFFKWNVWCQDQLQLYSIERDLSFRFGKLSQNRKKRR